MNTLLKYEKFFESKSNIEYKSRDLIIELCVSMILINNEFLDNILDRGLKARYVENSQAMITDLKNILLKKNRLRLGVFREDKFIIDEDISKVNRLFEGLTFDIEKDWTMLVDARIIARNIIDKIIPNEKLNENLIKMVYWTGPNKDKKNPEQIVIELNDGTQCGLHLDRSLSTGGRTSFHKFYETVLGKEEELSLYGPDMIKKWEELLNFWIKNIWKHSKKDTKVLIEKFIDPLRIDSISYFGYYDIKHRDTRFRKLGEYIPKLEKNVLKFSDLMDSIWRNREKMLDDYQEAEKKWITVKNKILNSSILEYNLSKSIMKKYKGDITKYPDGWKMSNGKLKMRLMKFFLDKIGSNERDSFGLTKKGNVLHIIPSRKFFRKFYGSFDILFDYHVSLKPENTKETFDVKLKIKMDDKDLIDMVIKMKPTGYMGEKLYGKIELKPIDNFNMVIYEKKKKNII